MGRCTRGMRQDGYQRGYVLQLKEKVRWFRGFWTETFTPVGRGKLQTKQIVADTSRDKQMLQDVLKKKALRPIQLRGLAQSLIVDYRVSVRRTCKIVVMRRATITTCHAAEMSRHLVEGSRRSLKSGSDMACGTFIPYSDAKAGKITTNISTGFTSWKD